MNKPVRALYEFGDFRLETAEQLLRHNGEPVSLTPKAFETLLVLVQRSGQLVDKDELLKEVWGDAFVEEANLARNIWTLRKALGDEKGEHRFIETVPKRGYRFIAPVKQLPLEAADVIVQRRVRAKIVSEEDDSDLLPSDKVSDSILTTALPVALAKTVPARKRKNAVFYVLPACALIVLAIAVVLIFRRAPQARSVENIKSIAVLPFANAGDPELDYLSEGITEDIINRLSHASNLKMIARSSVYRYKGKQIDPHTVGRELNVQGVLIGQVIRRGDNLTINTEFVDVRDGSRVWGEHYERKISDLQFLQGELAQRVANGLQLQLSGEKQSKLDYTHDAEAYQLYLKGRYFWNKRTEAGLQKGIEYFQKSVERDPTYALAYAGLADSYIIIGNWRFAPSADAYQKARAAAQRALELDPQLAEAKTSLAYTTLLYQWDWNGAEKGFREAIALNPNYASAHHFYSICLLTAGRQEEALAEIQRAQELDPLSLIITSVHGWIHYEGRQFDQATDYFKKTLEMDPQYVPALLDLGACYLRRGDNQKAMEQFQKARAAGGDTNRILADLAQAYALSGQRASALKVLEQIEQSSNFVSPWDLSFVYAALGQKTRAIELLEKATDEKVGWVISLGVEPGFDSLRAEPRFQKLEERVGIPVGKR